MSKNNDRVRVDLETQEGLIIDRASLLSNLRLALKFGWGVGSWLIWLDLLRPVLLAAVWTLGLWIGKTRLSGEGGRGSLEFFLYYSIVLAAIFLLTFGWNRYNFYKYRGTDRRRPRGECGSAELARYYAVDPSEIERLSAANVEIHFGEGDEITIHTDGGHRVVALYAPQNLDKHFESLKGKEEPAVKVLG